MAAYVELYGLWLSMQVFSGIVEKLGDTRSGSGHLWPTPDNLTLAYSRLATIALPGWALLFYLFGWAARLLLVCCLLSRRR